MEWSRLPELPHGNARPGLCWPRGHHSVQHLGKQARFSSLQQAPASVLLPS